MKTYQKPTTLIPEDTQLQLQPLSWLLEFQPAGVMLAKFQSDKPSVLASLRDRQVWSAKQLGQVKGPASGALP